MSRVGVIVALVVALVLALAGFMLLRPPSGGSPHAGPLLNVEASKITEIRIAAPGAEPQVARRLPGGSWVIILGNAEPWPATGERIRPALRILSTLEPVRPAERDAEVVDFVTVTLTQEDGAIRTLRLAPRSLAGAVLVEVDTPSGVRRAWVDADISGMLVGTGLGEWRDRSAMGGLDGDVSRIRLRLGGEGGADLALGRIEGRWALTSPVAEPAEPDAVARLFRLIGDTGVVDFLDQGPPAGTGLDTPAAVLVLESDHRDPSDPARVTTRQRTLEVGRISDISGRNVFARLSGQSGSRGGGSGAWSRVVVLNGQPLAEITTDPARYIARKALQTPAADIGRLVVTDETGQSRKGGFTRSLDGWRRLDGAGLGLALAPADGPGLQAMLDILTAAQADAVLLRQPPDVTWAATIEVQSLGNMPLARVRLGVMGDGKGVLGDEGVWRVYPAAAVKGGLDWASGL